MMIENKELLSRLCHIVALTEARKLEAVVDGLIVEVAEIDPRHPIHTIEELQGAIEAYFGITLELDVLRNSIQRLGDSEKLTFDEETEIFVLTSAAKSDAEDRVKNAHELEMRVKIEWLEIIESFAPHRSESQNEELWNCLKAYLASVFKQHGAQTILVISGEASDQNDEYSSLSDIAGVAIETECKEVPRDVARRALQAFFKDQSEDRSQYTAQLLDSTFSFFALYHDDAVSEYLKKTLPKITIFLDTNFLFGVLDLHDNPQNEVSNELVNLITSQSLPFSLTYHEDSLIELLNSIAIAEKELKQKYWPKGLSAALLRVRKSDLSGIKLKFHEENAKRETDVSSFFLKFKHIEKILAEKKFTIFRREKPFDQTKYDTETLSIVSKYKRYLEEVLPEGKMRPFKAIRHDVEVWRTVKERRLKGASGLDVGSIFLSADKRLFEFDWKVMRSGNTLGLVVLPSQFLQLLRPFIPRTRDFDKKFAEIFSLPEFRALEADYTRVSEKVITILSQFKNISEETALAIMADEVLLRRLQNIEDDSQAATLLESEVLRQNELLLRKSAEAEIERNSIHGTLQKVEKTVNQQKELIREKDSALLRTKTHLEATRESLDDAEERSRELNLEIENSRNQLEELKAASEKDKRLSRLNQDAYLEEIASLKNSVLDLQKTRKANETRVRLVLGLLFCLIGWGLIFYLPLVRNSEWLANHERKFGLYLAAILVVPAVAWTIFSRVHRIWPLGVIVVGVFLELIGVL